MIKLSSKMTIRQQFKLIGSKWPGLWDNVSKYFGRMKVSYILLDPIWKQTNHLNTTKAKETIRNYTKQTEISSHSPRSTLCMYFWSLPMDPRWAIAEERWLSCDQNDIRMWHLCLKLTSLTGVEPCLDYLRVFSYFECNQTLDAENFNRDLS